MKPWLLALVLGGCATVSAPTRQQAGDALERGDAKEAYHAFAKLVCNEPADLSLARSYVEAWSQLGRPGTPQFMLSECDVPPYVFAYVSALGHALFGENHLADLALQDAQKAGAPRDEIALRRGLIALAMDPAQARQHLSQAATLSPTRVDVRLAWAQAVARTQGVKATRDVLVGILRLSPSAADIVSARRILNNALRAKEAPLDPYARQLASDALSALQRGEPTQAWTVRLEQALGETPHERLLLTLGLFRLKQGEMEDARALLLQAAQNNPFNPEAVRALGLTLYASERPDEAYGYLREAALRDPFDTEVQTLLAGVALSRGDKQVSQEAREALVVLTPNAVDNYVALARLLRERGQLAAAEQVVECGALVSRDEVPLLFERATVFFAKRQAAQNADDLKKAQEQLNLAVGELLRVAPNHPGAAALK